MELTKQRRLEIYVEVLFDLQEGDGFCGTILSVLNKQESHLFMRSDGLEMFPELMEYKPLRPFDVYWFPTTGSGYQLRIDILATIIAEMLTTPPYNEEGIDPVATTD